MKCMYGWLIVLPWLFAACNRTEEKGAAAPKPSHEVSSNLNISILLDLSDRIDPQKYPNPSMEYYLRDVGYINTVYKAFSNHVKGKKIIQIDDRLQLFFDPPPLNPDINTISKNLQVRLSRQNVSKKLLSEIEQRYDADPLHLYQLAIKDHHYIGSDTWTFFKNRVNDYCIDPQHRNIMVILTDGYIFYKNAQMRLGNQTSYLTPELIRREGLNTPLWHKKITDGKYGFFKANPDLSDLEILVIGINPNPGNPYEEDVIKAYWSKWFEDMKVKRYEIRTSDLPSNLETVIQDFISFKQPAG